MVLAVVEGELQKELQEERNGRCKQQQQQLIDQSRCWRFPTVRKNSGLFRCLKQVVIVVGGVMNVWVTGQRARKENSRVDTKKQAQGMQIQRDKKKCCYHALSCGHNDPIGLAQEGRCVLCAVCCLRIGN